MYVHVVSLRCPEKRPSLTPISRKLARLPMIYAPTAHISLVTSGIGPQQPPTNNPLAKIDQDFQP